jgi:hypothetical protein
MRKLPPKKQLGQGVGPRTINGAVLDVRGAAAFLGTTEKTLRGLIDRRLVPFRRLNSRVILVRSELETLLVGLPGCTLDEAKTNMEMRHAAR